MLLLHAPVGVIVKNLIVKNKRGIEEQINHEIFAKPYLNHISQNKTEMAETTNTPGMHETLSSTDLSFERTMLSHERTLMSWIRTATSMITFGFTIYKFFDEMSAEGGAQTFLTPRVVGMTMISLGFLGLLLAQIQHHTAIKRLKKIHPDVQWSVSSLLAVLILIFGLIMFMGVLFRQ